MGSESADLVLKDAMIFTATKKDAECFAGAIAIKGDRIAAVERGQAIEHWIDGQTRVVSLGGKMVLPGFIDTHAHLLMLGMRRRQIDLSAVASEESAAELVRKKAATAPSGEWIRGFGWDQNRWQRPEFPSLRSISDAAPEHPVFLDRVDIHACWVNRKALELAGITRQTEDPAGGAIVRDGDGNPTGILVDRARDLVVAKIPPLDLLARREALRLAMQECLAYGITTIHDLCAGAMEMETFFACGDADELKVRISAAIDVREGDLFRDWMVRGTEVGLFRGMFDVRSVKLFSDGALGSRGAALLKCYADDKKSHGILLLDEKQIAEIAGTATKHGFQVCTHAIGDAANRTVLNAYERVMEQNGAFAALRPRLEHAQIVDRADVKRFGKLGVIAAVQTSHCSSDLSWVETRLGKRRAETAYPWKALQKSGARLANGSDAPIETLNPMYGIYAAVTRQTPDGNPADGWHAKQRMTLADALRSYTAWGAFAGFEERSKGTIEAGKLADLVVMSENLSGSPVQSILDTKPLLTILGGRIVYQNDSLADERLLDGIRSLR